MHWWVKLGFPAFDPWKDDPNYPNPGQVTKFFREQKILVLPNGASRSCRQIDLAVLLGVSESWVRAMENNSESFDSLSRRKALIAALGIPPILFGLVSSEDLTQPGNLSAAGTKSYVNQAALQWFKGSLRDSWDLYYTGTSYDLQSNVEQKISYLKTFIDAHEESEQVPFLDLKARFHHLVARIAVDQQNYKEAFSQLRVASVLARRLNSDGLLATTLFWRGRAYLEREDVILGDFKSATMVLDKALKTVPSTLPQLHGAILLEGGLAHAYTATTQGEKDGALSYFTQAWEFARQDHLENDGSFVKLTVGRFYHFKAEALIAMGMPEQALKILDTAEEKTGPELTRRRAYINILKSRAYLDIGDYSSSAHSALDALQTCQAIQSDVNIEIIRGISGRLSTSLYKNLEPVTKLRVALG